MNNERKIVERSYSLDLLKIIATMFIFFHHYQQVTGAYFSRINFYCGKFDFAYIVELFFLMSGYFIYTYEDKIRSGLSFKKFFGRRMSRLLPIVAISAVAFNFVNAIYFRFFAMNWFAKSVTMWGTITTALGISQGWGVYESAVNYPTWYISALLLCYCVFYLIVYIAKRLKLPTEYMYMVMICIGMGGLTYSVNQTFLTFGNARAYYSFFFGVLLKMFLEKYKISKSMIKIAVVMVVFIPFMIIVYPAYMLDGINYIATFFLYPSIIILLETDTVKRICQWKIIGKLSAISYDVYVWHLLLLIVIISLNHRFGWNIVYNDVLFMIACLILAFVIGTISHYMLEKPINRYIDEKFFKE